MNRLRQPLKTESGICAPSKVAQYKGIRPPKCHGGEGCRRCKEKYAAVQAAGAPEPLPNGARVVVHLDAVTFLYLRARASDADLTVSQFAARILRHVN